MNMKRRETKISVMKGLIKSTRKRYRPRESRNYVPGLKTRTSSRFTRRPDFTIWGGALWSPTIQTKVKIWSIRKALNSKREERAYSESMTDTQLHRCTDNRRIRIFQKVFSAIDGMSNSVSSPPLCLPLLEKGKQEAVGNGLHCLLKNKWR